MAEDARPDVLLARQDGVVTLTLSAPWRGNSLDGAMLARLEAHLTGLDDDVRVVVLRGQGERAFSTGYHLPTLAEELEAGPSVVDYEGHPLERALRALEGAPVPTIAALRGNAYGAGCELALACDIRIGSLGCRLCMPPARLGILYSATGLRRLVALAGPAAARELIFTAEPVTGERALALGLLNHLVAPEALEERVAAMAARIAANAPLSIRHHKQVFRRFTEPPPLTDADLEAVAALREECFRSPEFADRLARALARRR